MSVRNGTLKYAAAVVALLSAVSGAWAAPPLPVSISAQPGQPLIEQGKGQQLLNFDFKIDNQSGDKIELSGIEVSVLGAADKLVAQFVHLRVTDQRHSDLNDIIHLTAVGLSLQHAR